jgi:hypothetical protein
VCIVRLGLEFLVEVMKFRGEMVALQEARGW